MERHINLAVAGVGNNISALTQGISYYKQLSVEGIINTKWPGLKNPELFGFMVYDIDIVAAFDIDPDKVGKSIKQAVFGGKNNYPVLGMGVPDYNNIVQQGITEEQDTKRVADELVKSKTEVLLYSLPTGLQKIAEMYAKAAYLAGVGFINCTPEYVARNKDMNKMFTDKGLPLLGDDLASHFGSSIYHKNVINLIKNRGLTLESTYQINLGGNEDFKNLIQNGASKAKSKMNALRLEGNEAKIEIIPSGGYISQLNDNKVAYFHVYARGWAGTPVEIDTKLRVQDSSNAAGVIIDLVRIAGYYIRQKVGGYKKEADDLLKSPAWIS